MTTVFNKLHRIKNQPGWTWERVLEAVDRVHPAGINEKTLYAHFHQPHKRANGHVSKIVDTLHEECFPNPFPEDVNRLMGVYNRLAERAQRTGDEQEVDDLEYFLKSLLQRESPDEQVRLARLHWLLGNISFDRIPCYRDNGQRKKLDQVRNQAVDHYHKSVTALVAHNERNPGRKVGAHHLYKARHNILACHLNSVARDARATDPGVLRYLKESNYIAASKQTLREEPFQWSIARDGLRFSSLLRNAEDAEYFFDAMVAVSGKFLDLNYEPLDTDAIARSADFKWAVANVLTPQHIARCSCPPSKPGKPKYANE